MIEIDNAILGNIEPRHLESLTFFQMLDCIEHGVMFNLVDNVSPLFDLTALSRRVCPGADRARETEHGEIARFGSTACENNFMRLRSNQIGDFIACIIDRGARNSSGGVHA